MDAAIHVSQGNDPETDRDSTALIEEQSDDYDSAFGDDDPELDGSISSSIFDYPFRNGRRYHAYDAKYPYPNDELEQERLGRMHYVWKIALGGTDLQRRLWSACEAGRDQYLLYQTIIGENLGKLGLAHLDKPDGLRLVVDVGTGTGVWAIDFADEHPETQVIGFDISPIQPAWMPPNLEFEVDDANRPLEREVDGIFVRDTIRDISEPFAFFQDCFCNIRSGGYIEVQQSYIFFSCDDDSMEGTRLQYWTNLLKAADHRAYQDIGALEGDMAKAGFDEIQVVRFKLPINTWPKDTAFKTVGSLVFQMLMSPGSLESLSYEILIGPDMTKENLDIILALMRSELRSSRIHAYFYAYVVYGRKL